MVYKVEQVAELLKLKPTTIRTWLREGTLEGTRVGKSWVIETDALKKMFPVESFNDYNDEYLNRSFNPAHTEEMFKDLYPTEYEQFKKDTYHPAPMEVYQEECLKALDRRFLYPYLEDRSYYIKSDEPESHYHFYCEKYKEEELKLNRFMQLLIDKHGVSEEDVAEIKRTFENLQLLKIGKLIHEV